MHRKYLAPCLTQRGQLEEALLCGPENRIAMDITKVCFLLLLLVDSRWPGALLMGTE